ncbi:MAG TPA: hypothetical protein VI407_01680 [Erythrobacter sp.]
MADKDSTPAGADPEGGGRRKGDRRKAQLPFEGEDRRKGDRRSGADRRATPRGDVTD